MFGWQAQPENAWKGRQEPKEIEEDKRSDRELIKCLMRRVDALEREVSSLKTTVALTNARMQHK